MSAPDPLTPEDCDLRAFPTMPLDAVRLFGSEFHAVASDAAWRAGVTLWLRSWHQVPAASLPDDDVLLARLAELGRDVKAWKKIRVQALHGWIKCSDGRLYHPVVADMAIAAWAKRVAFKERSRKGNSKRWGDRKEEAGDPNAILEGSEKDSSNDPKGEGEERERESNSSVANATAADAPPSLPPDPARLVFDAGVPLLARSGKPEAAARSLLGKWRKAQGDAAVIEALGAAQREAAIDPVGFIEGRWRATRKADADSFSIGGVRMNSPC